jgi:hypothetical protein
MSSSDPPKYQSPSPETKTPASGKGALRKQSINRNSEAKSRQNRRKQRNAQQSEWREQAGRCWPKPVDRKDETG